MQPEPSKAGKVRLRLAIIPRFGNYTEPFEMPAGAEVVSVVWNNGDALVTWVEPVQ